MAAAVKRGEVPSALHHYRNHGLIEGRQVEAARPEFVLHIGPHKTGSSHIQARITANEPVLASHGIALPLEWKRSKYDHNHTRLVDALYAGDSEALNAQVARLISGSQDRVLVSAEDLCLLPVSLVEELGQVLFRHNVTIVYYLRCWATRIYSVWQEQVRHGYVHSFKSYLAEHLIAPADSEIINPSLCLDRFSSVFGLSSIRVIPYEQTLSSSTDIYEHFASTVLGVDGVEAEVSGERTHASPSFMETEIARILNLTGARSGHQRLGMTYLDHRSLFTTSVIAGLLQGYVTNVEIDTQAEPLPLLEYSFCRKYLGSIAGIRTTNPLAPRKSLIQSVASTCLFDSKVRIEARRLARKVIQLL